MIGLLETFLKLINMLCAVSGLKYAIDDVSATAPRLVWNISLNSLTSVHFFMPQEGHGFSKFMSSARNLFLQFWQSTMGSLKHSTWPDAFQTCCAPKIDPSKSTTSSGKLWIFSSHNFFILFLSRVPIGPNHTLH